MAGNSSSPASSIWYSRWTPVVVSSDTPRTPPAMRVHRCGSEAKDSVRLASTTCHSSGSSSLAVGTTPTASNSDPLWTSRVASPPSSRIRLGPSPSGHSRTWRVAHQYSSSVSPFQANTGTPRRSSGEPSGPHTAAAAAWSWVEKMLQLAHRTRAPRTTRVSMRTAVCTVMCSDPAMRAPARGCWSANSARRAMRPGISCSARRISLRPNPWSARSATRWSSASGGVVDMTTPLRTPVGCLRGSGQTGRVLGTGLGSSDAVQAATDPRCYRRSAGR